MRILTQQSFDQLLIDAAIRPRVKREVRFASSVAGVSEDEWVNTEIIGITDRSGSKGVVLLEHDSDSVYVAAYELKTGMTSSNGRAQAIICDFCRTWQTGGRSGSLTLVKPGSESGSVTFLCCADLACSRHVRNLTSAAKTSRSQLREDMTIEQRIERLRKRIDEISGLVGLEPIRLT